MGTDFETAVADIEMITINKILKLQRENTELKKMIMNGEVQNSQGNQNIYLMGVAQATRHFKDILSQIFSLLDPNEKAKVKGLLESRYTINSENIFACRPQGRGTVTKRRRAA
jgi:hypothetical protein